MKQKKFALMSRETLRIRKRHDQFFAYARVQEFGCQKERYLGRCNSDGSIYESKGDWERYRSRSY